MRLLFTLLISFTFCITYAQETARDGRPISVNANSQYFISGPPLESANQISESFEAVTFPPAGWSKLNVAGGTGWDRITVGTTPIPGWNGGEVTTPPVAGSGTAMAFMTYNLGGANANDNWLITPQLMNVGPGDTLSFWMRKFSDLYADNMDIRISTTVNNNAAAFNTVVQNIVFAATDTGWAYYSYQIGNLVPPGSNIYIGFRNHVANNLVDGAAMFIELVNAGGPFVPVELASFTASAADNNVNINWTTATELNNRGFEIQKLTGDQFLPIGFVQGYGTTAETKSYTFIEQNVASGTYSYRLKQVDFNGSFEYSPVVEVSVNQVSEFSLNQNYPNPFNPVTNINFMLLTDSKVSLKVFNLLGQEVASLINANMNAGAHDFNFDASGLNSGVYFYQIQVEGIDGSRFTDVKKMILTK